MDVIFGWLKSIGSQSVIAGLLTFRKRVLQQLRKGFGSCAGVEARKGQGV